MQELESHPDISDLQKYVALMELERSFDDQTSIEKCLLVGEEVGELFKAVRKAEGLKMASHGSEVARELADVLIYLCAIANRYDIDLESAFRSTEALNESRGWK
tara:strand:+ start:156 stop:467 length:312 start_codon:yes stop_codon:yes gene_type:complete